MKSVLIVEDEPSYAKLLVYLLEQEGYRTTTKPTAEEGLTSCKKNTPDLIVSDLKMGDMDGLTFLKIVRSNDKLKDIPFVLITASAERDITIMAKEQGATACLLKPVDMDQVLKIVKELVPL